jgi:hypothetical protein
MESGEEFPTKMVDVETLSDVHVECLLPPKHHINYSQLLSIR